MNKYSHYKENAFFIIYFISIYAILLLSLMLSKLFSDTNIFVSYAIPQIVYVLVTIIYSKVSKVEIKKAMPVQFRLPIAKFVWVFVATVGIFSFSLLPNLMIMSFFVDIGLSIAVNVPALNGLKNIILSIGIVCVMPAIGEEMMFRGICNNSFKEYGGIAVVLLSGLIFSLSHFNIAQTVYQFFLGMLLSYLFLKTHNLLIPICIHFLNNFFALFLPLMIPFFATLSFDIATFAVLVPLFFVGGFVAVLAIRKLIGSTSNSAIVTVFEYSPSQDDFVAVDVESVASQQKENFFYKIGYQIKQTFVAILEIFNTHKRGQKINRFKELYPKTKNISSVIKILIVAIIGMWIISVIV